MRLVCSVTVPGTSPCPAKSLRLHLIQQMLCKEKLLRKCDLKLASFMVRALNNNLRSPGSLGKLRAQIVRYDLA